MDRNLTSTVSFVEVLLASLSMLISPGTAFEERFGLLGHVVVIFKMHGLGQSPTQHKAYCKDSPDRKKGVAVMSQMHELCLSPNGQ